MIDIREIRFDPDSLYSLVSLNALIEEVIGGASHEYFTYSRYKNQREYGCSWTGAYFEIQYKREELQRRAWAFFGLTFDEPSQTHLSVCLDRDWNTQLVDSLNESVELPQGRTCLRDDELRVNASDDDLQDLLTLALQDQRTKLQSLFSELMHPIEQCMAKT